MATSNRLNNRLIRAEEEDTVLEDLCRIFRERESQILKSISQNVYCILNLVSVPVKSWYSAHSISNQLTAFRQSIDYQDVNHISPVDWDVILHRHVFPFWRRVHQHSNAWLSMETLQSASLSMRAVKHLTKEVDSTYAFVRSARYNILMTHCLAWYWLESVCAYHSQPCVTIDSSSMSWPCKLARYLYMVFETRLSTFSLRPSDYIPHLSSESQSFRTIGIIPLSIANCSPSLQLCVYMQMKRVLQVWLDFPHDDFADGQAWLLHNFISVFGSGSLLLDETWEIYHHMSKHVLGRQRNRTRTIFMHQLVPFFYYIQSCEASNKDSSARSLLDQYRTEHTMYESGKGQKEEGARFTSVEAMNSFEGRLQGQDDVRMNDVEADVAHSLSEDVSPSYPHSI